MDDLMWGLGMMAAGMGTVFALLVALMLLLMLIGRLDRQPGDPTPAAAEPPAGEPDAAAPAGPRVVVDADGLDDDTLAAIAVAVMTHAENRRRLAAPEVRSHAPGSQLFASRWVAIGRGLQNALFTRR